ncbi:hypothetical protein EDD11_009114 [Mortierella claussenii]|nr:hypothetical protein EDD11_009114 [Mortierella claussenii]
MVVVVLLSTSSLFTKVSASITCALPAGSSYKAGDAIILDWGSDGTMPVVQDITAINGTLYCNGNNARIADVPIPNLTGPYNWTVPSVGNATTAGGLVGVCPQNAFHMEYSGEAAGFLSIGRIPWGPVRCGTITILPAPNGTVITTTTTTMASTSTTSTTSPTVTSTDTPSNSGGGLSTTVVVIIAVVAAVLVTLSVVALVVCIRRNRRQRNLDDALKPWTNNSNRFSQVPSMDEGPRSPGGAGTGAGRHDGIGMSSIAATAAAAGLGSPSLPQSSRNGSSYYPDDGDYGNYGLHQQQQLLHHHQQQLGYDGYNEEDKYYNPYYSGVSSAAAGAVGFGVGAAAVMNQSNPSFYSMNHPGAPGNHLRSPYGQDQQQQQQPPYQGGDLSQQHHVSGYFPPPPPPRNESPVSSLQSYTRPPVGTHGGSGTTTMSGGDKTVVTTSSSDLTSSPKRAPQTVMQEMGRKEAEEDEKQRKDEKEEGKVEPSSPLGKEKVDITLM